MLKNKDCAKSIIHKFTLINRYLKRLGCIYKWQQNTLCIFLDSNCSIRVYQLLVTIFQKYFLLHSVTHYAQNYAGIIGRSLNMITIQMLTTLKLQGITDMKYLIVGCKCKLA